jgi:hypothetical protein
MVHDKALDAHDCYSNAWKLVQGLSGERGDTLVWWLEEALYRRPLIQMVYGQVIYRKYIIIYLV